MVKAHYDNHLAKFYVWMSGDFDSKSMAFQDFLETHQIFPNNTSTAIDLGAGHGIQSIALKNIGFSVTAIDFSEYLLSKLKSHPNSKSIQTIKADIRDFQQYSPKSPELIICCGDTLMHLVDKKAIEGLIRDCVNSLGDKGKLILSFRDYTNLKKNEQVFIPVKSDEHRILTCILEAKSDQIRVTDLLHEKVNNQWHQKVSTYYKVNISPVEIEKIITELGLTITINQNIKGMHTLIAQKS